MEWGTEAVSDLLGRKKSWDVLFLLWKRCGGVECPGWDSLLGGIPEVPSVLTQPRLAMRCGPCRDFSRVDFALWFE